MKEQLGEMDDMKRELELSQDQRKNWLEKLQRNKQKDKDRVQNFERISSTTDYFLITGFTLVIWLILRASCPRRELRARAIVDHSARVARLARAQRASHTIILQLCM